MKAHEAFPGNYIKAADLGNARALVTIKSVTSESLGDDEKRVVSFVGKDKLLALNKTNWNMIAEITRQDDDENWAGQKIVLYAAMTDFQGKRVPCIRVDYPPKGTQPAPTPPPADPESFTDNDEEVPF